MRFNLIWKASVSRAIETVKLLFRDISLEPIPFTFWTILTVCRSNRDIC